MSKKPSMGAVDGVGVDSAMLLLNIQETRGMPTNAKCWKLERDGDFRGVVSSVVTGESPL